MSNQQEAGIGRKQKCGGERVERLELERHGDVHAIAVPQPLDMRIARPETHFFIDRHRGSEAVGGFKIDLGMAAMPGMIERKFHQLAARAGPARFGEQHDPAQLAALAAIDAGAADVDTESDPIEVWRTSTI